VATFVLTVWLLQRGEGVDGVLLAAGLGIFLGALFMLPGVLGRGRDNPLEQTAGSAAGLSLSSRRFLGYALPFGGIALLNFAVHSQTEVFFLGYYHDAETAGFFHHGFTFAQRLIDFLPLALWEVSMAGFSRIAVRDAARLPGALKAYLTLLYLAMAPLALLGVAFSVPAIVLLYGEKMLPSAIVAQSYFVMAAIAAFGAPVGMILYARERVGAALRAYMIFAAVNLGLDLALIPSLGLWGAILGLGAAKVVAVVLMSRLAWGEIPDLQVPWSFIGRAFVASSPVLLWLLVDDRWLAPWQVVLGGLGALVVLVSSFRLLRVVGEREAALIRGTRLPLREPVLRLLGHRGLGVSAEAVG
jgi:O-antigen/teichoic acid export membrane protein